MATAHTLPEMAAEAKQDGAQLLVMLAAMSEEQTQAALACLAKTFAPRDIVVAAPEPLAAAGDSPLRVIAAPAARPSWTLTAADFAHAHRLAQENDVKGVLVLGPESGSLRSDSLSALAASVLESPRDLAVACYDLPPNVGLVNSAILYPLSRALFAARPRFPMAIDLALSPRMATRMSNAAQRFLNLNQGEAPLWPLSEAAVAGYTVNEIEVGARTLPHPADPDLNSVLPAVTGSLFADIEAKAAFWQRPRQSPPLRTALASAHAHEAGSDTTPMVQAFRLAYTNLQEIWSLVLPPNSLLGLKRLSLLEAGDFVMPDNLWARIVYDFLVGWKTRTINRGHLLGALVPLYLGWVASHFRATAGGQQPEQHIEAVVAAFEVEKPYLVSRWRWPDRFNP